MLTQDAGLDMVRGAEHRFRPPAEGVPLAGLVHDELLDADGADSMDILSHEVAAQELQTRLLSALSAMAMRSKRRQADLNAAMQRAGIAAARDLITTALRALEDAGCIEHMVPLYDGGMIISVTSRGIEHLTAGPRWTMMELQRRA